MTSTSRFDLRPGLTLGRNYYVVEFLGSGWEGEVFKVEERRTGILRAAKIFYDHSTLKPAQLKRYTRKLHKLRGCPIITQYHHRDMARVGGRQMEILVSDLAEGILLSTYLSQRPGKRLIPFEALHLIHSLARGVEQIHLLGEYHGDIHTDNIMVFKKGLGFEVHLIDFLDLGRSTREKIQVDVYDLLGVLHELVGGTPGYKRCGEAIRKLVLGRRHDLISRKYRTAGQLRLAIENLEW
jgi:serine/threonine protein kinase